MSIEKIGQIKKEVERMFDVKLKKLPRKKIIYEGVAKDNKTLVLISPSSKLHTKGHGWVDITKIQRDLALERDLAIIAFRLPDRKTYYVDFDKLSEHLSEETMMNNSREGDHWKLYIWPKYIEIRKCDTKLPIRPNDGVILDGVYSAVGKALQVFIGQQDADKLKKLLVILQSAKRDDLDADKVANTINETTPEFSKLADFLPKTRTELYAFLVVIIMFITLLLSLGKHELLSKEISQYQEIILKRIYKQYGKDGTNMVIEESAAHGVPAINNLKEKKMGNCFPKDEQKFNELMSKLDCELAKQKLDIAKRPLSALGIISERFGIPLPLGRPMPRTHPELSKYWPISERVKKWYEHRYGDRLKMDFSSGRMAFMIDEDVWVFRFPRLYGSAEFVSSKTIKSERIRTDGKPVTYNILDCIESLPDGFRMSLSDSQLVMLGKYFRLGFEVFSSLEMLSGNDLIMSAKADISASIGHLFARQPQYGLSKWSSLQAAEKLLKSAIEMRGGNYSKTHKLKKLVEEVKKCGLSLGVSIIIAEIQCTPAIRYGKEPCSKTDAIRSHHAVFELAKAIIKGMKFE